MGTYNIKLKKERLQKCTAGIMLNLKPSIKMDRNPMKIESCPATIHPK
jgi:hypothetical protein